MIGLGLTDKNMYFITNLCDIIFSLVHYTMIYCIVFTFLSHVNMK